MSLILPESTRYDKLKGWLVSHGLNIKKIAKAAGLTEAAARWNLSRERLGQKRLDVFLALGIPKHLLPKPRSESAD